MDKPVNDFRQVISGFPGVGKTNAYEILKARGVKVLDSDSSTFDKTHFPENYLDHIETRYVRVLRNVVFATSSFTPVKR